MTRSELYFNAASVVAVAGHWVSPSLYFVAIGMFIYGATHRLAEILGTAVLAATEGKKCL